MYSLASNTIQVTNKIEFTLFHFLRYSQLKVNLKVIYKYVAMLFVFSLGLFVVIFFSVFF